MVVGLYDLTVGQRDPPDTKGAVTRDAGPVQGPDVVAVVLIDGKRVST